MLYPIPYIYSFERKDFTNPFRYVPHPLVRAAAAEVLSRLETWKESPDGSPERELERSFAEGKMMGVLICRKLDSDGEYSPSEVSEHHNGKVSPLFYLAAFSGTVRGADGNVTSTVDGFVPPVIDLTSAEGYFKRKEAEISQMNQQIADLSSSSILKELKETLKRHRLQQEAEIENMQAQILISKKKREEIRKATTDALILADLIKESQFQKAELKRLKDKWKDILGKVSSVIAQFEKEITILKQKRAQMSDELQKWIFESAIVHNAVGEVSSIWDIFTSLGLVPPGGTGDCAAPKLLEYAYRNRLEPLAMGEFWYGHSPETAVRTHGHFYPSCTSKCGPLLEYMMQGLKGADWSQTQEDKTNQQVPIIIHEDESVIVIEKPRGMPSVPGLDGRESLQEWISRDREVHSVHRLDMDTSGVMVFAKTSDAAVCLRKQFEEHTISKTYMARVTPWTQREGATKFNGSFLRHQTQTGFKDHQPGSIDLPLSPDYDERPRQKVDFKQGKQAHTEYEIVKEYADGTADLLLYPHTGRTHQLRVHCAHTLGLGRPILGDLLYGAHTAEGSAAGEGCTAGLCLHALSITFRHPDTDVPQTFTSSLLCY